MAARVIKIEGPGTGDFARGCDQRVRGLASHFVWARRSKESLTLDLKHPRAAELLIKLSHEHADCVVQNLAPGAAARLRVSWEALKSKRPDLVVCDISGYGDDPNHPGPYRDKKAYDLLIQSESGFVSITGTADEPSKAGTGYPLYYAFEGAKPPLRAGAAHATIYPYGPFPCGDGKTVMLGLQNEREWLQFCSHVLLQPALAEDERFQGNAKRTAQRDTLRALIVEAFPAMSCEQVVQRLEDAQIANAQLRDMAGLWQHEQLAARNRWREVATPAGPVPTLLPPGSWGPQSGGDPRLDAVPALGQHTGAVLTELGVGAAEIAELRAAEVI